VLGTFYLCLAAARLKETVAADRVQRKQYAGDDQPVRQAILQCCSFTPLIVGYLTHVAIMPENS
jgi:hypothetical protein